MTHNCRSDIDYSELWICDEPPDDELPQHALLLSFMGAHNETMHKEKYGDRLISGRAVAQDVRSRARNAYMELAVNIAATPCRAGKTLRQSLTGSDGVSRWWYVKLSQKNSVGINDHYTSVIRLYCIKSVADKYKISIIRLFGKTHCFSPCLEGSYRIVNGDDSCKRNTLLQISRITLRGMAARVYFILYYFYILFLLKRLRPKKERHYDAALQGYWNWSITPQADGTIRDRYFKDLRDRLQERGVSVCWLSRFSPRFEGWQRRYSIREIADALVRYPEVVIVERFMNPVDVIMTALNLRYLLVFFKFSFFAEFRSLFVRDGINFYPLLGPSLLSSFAGNEIHHSELLAKAAERACAVITPNIVLTFLELFLESRALSVGARRAYPSVLIYAAQHAAYCSEKTFGHVNKEVEFVGTPDHCPMPVPDGILSMGELSYDIWINNGFPADRVIRTGGLRFQHIKVSNDCGRKRPGGYFNILLVAGMNEHLDFDMCEAVYAATAELSSVRLRIRNHPSYWITDMKGFEKFRERIEVSQVDDALEDLACSDLIIFTHSSLPEEALLKGVPIWQWLWAGFNTSVFVDIPVIPSFTSVNELKNALERIIESPEDFSPDEDLKRLVLMKCFGSNPQNAGVLVSDAILEMVRSN